MRAPPDARASKPRVPPAPSVAHDSLVVTFAFRCNLACTFCMVEDVLEAPYPGVSLERFEALCRDPTSTLQGLRRVTFSGGEVTTSKLLPDYVRLARSLPEVRHVRIQTNATRLRDRAYLRSLLDAGVDELFVSFHGHDAASTEAITRRPGSFDQILAGMREIRAAGATLITNTALVRQNYQSLAAIVEVVAPLAPASIEMWSFWPRIHEHTREFAVPVAELRGPVIAAMRACLARGIPPVLKWFPRCLVPPDLLPYHDDGQPQMLIEPEFWDREPGYGCLYAGVCEDHHAQRCSGLSHAYVELHGWEQDLLRPRRVEASDRARAGGAGDDFVLRNLVKDGGPKRTHTARVAAWLDAFGLAFGGEVAGWTLVSARRSRFRESLRLELRRSERRAVLQIAAGDPTPKVVVVGDARARREAEPLARALGDALSRCASPPPIP
ncbi:MAG: radical SAM protein [Myxococcales bacterium]|nr:radical SAM protein [Myxococcales bacterium]